MVALTAIVEYLVQELINSTNDASIASDRSSKGDVADARKKRLISRNVLSALTHDAELRATTSRVVIPSSGFINPDGNEVLLRAGKRKVGKRRQRPKPYA